MLYLQRLFTHATTRILSKPVTHMPVNENSENVIRRPFFISRSTIPRKHRKASTTLPPMLSYNEKKWYWCQKMQTNKISAKLQLNSKFLILVLILSELLLSLLLPYWTFMLLFCIICTFLRFFCSLFWRGLMKSLLGDSLLHEAFLCL